MLLNVLNKEIKDLNVIQLQMLAVDLEKFLVYKYLIINQNLKEVKNLLYKDRVGQFCLPTD